MTLFCKTSGMSTCSCAHLQQHKKMTSFCIKKKNRILIETEKQCLYVGQNLIASLFALLLRNVVHARSSVCTLSTQCISRKNTAPAERVCFEKCAIFFKGNEGIQIRMFGKQTNWKMTSRKIRKQTESSDSLFQYSVKNTYIFLQQMPSKCNRISAFQFVRE